MPSDDSSSGPIPITLTAAKHRVEAQLNGYFDARRSAATAIDPSYERLWNSIHGLYQSGGKRLRPFLTLLGYQAYNPSGDLATIEPAAAAQELLHLAMLIHDDIIDRDIIRYGTANVAGQYEVSYAEMLHDESERRHFSQSAAILAGDLLLSDAYKLLSQSDVDPARVLLAQRYLNEAVFTVVGGELLDTETAFTAHEFVRPLEIARLKTASYSFISPLVIGAVLAGAPDGEIARLRTYGEYVGMAYQLQDDVLGVFGNSLATGKSVKSDLSEGKYTYMVQLFFEMAPPEAIGQFKTIFGTGSLTDEDLETAKRLLEESGARPAIEQQIDQLCEQACAAADTLTLSQSFKQTLIDLVETLKRRSK